ncbi:hypothetical protein QYM36_008677 [Artemia franciscana]|nr:hypothetical protein QYM36_008677 [Artemia franciscana]
MEDEQNEDNGTISEEESEDEDGAEDEEIGDEEKVKETYLPGQPIEEGEELVCDESAYIMLHTAETGSPCLSFDIIRDPLGDNRTDFPVTTYIVAGTQSMKTVTNKVLIMKMSNLHKTCNDDDESTDEEEDEEQPEIKPNLDTAVLPHFGAVNRIRMTFVNEVPLASTWSDTGKVHIWDLTKPLQAVNDHRQLEQYSKTSSTMKPLYTFSGHLSEGFAMDWCPTQPGVLATGDCRNNIHVWKPQEAGLWHVEQRPYLGHSGSVEDIQWSPNEANVFASCSIDKSIRIWDARVDPSKACMLTCNNAHTSDVNVIHWNRNEPFIVSGGDDAKLCVWDLRQFQTKKPVATFKHHTAPITSVEWHPTDGTVFASTGEDDQVALWDLSVEKDDESREEDLKDLPPQLLFIHQGQKELKELHWHPQVPGLVITTSLTGFNVFKTISV